jgi:tRNA1(Val) A37 N6-methylase TrmN6
VIWPAADLEALLARASRAGLHAKRARFVHPLPDRAAHRVLVELKPGRPGGMAIAPALVLAERPGVPSAECVRITSGN